MKQTRIVPLPGVYPGVRGFVAPHSRDLLVPQRRVRGEVVARRQALGVPVLQPHRPLIVGEPSPVVVVGVIQRAVVPRGLEIALEHRVQS